MEPQAQKPLVSVIIPTHNSAQTLSKCIKSVKAQTYRQFEIIVVDDLSTDETVQMARDFGVKVLQRRCTPSLARNLGVAISTGEYLLFLDSDQALSPSVVEECVRKCEDENISMIFIPEMFVGKGFWSSCSAVWKNYYSKVQGIHEVGENTTVGEPRFFVKQCFIQAGMFNAALHWGEDQDLHKRIKAMSTNEASCKSKLYHYEPTSINKLLAKNLQYGKSMPIFLQETKAKVFSPMLKNALLTFREVFSNFKGRPSIIVGCAFLLFLKTYSIIVGLSIGSID